MTKFIGWGGGKLVKARWFRRLFRLTAIPGVPGAAAIAAGLHWQMPWLIWCGVVLIAPFGVVFVILPAVLVLTICGLIMLAIGQSVFRPSKKKQLERARQHIARVEAERAAHKAARGPGFFTGNGTPEPCITLIAPPEELIDLDPNTVFPSLAATVDAVNASKARRNQRVLDQQALGASRLGGLPDLPPDLAWPTYKGKKLPFLAQIDLAALPRSSHTLLPADGWWYAFGLHDNDADHRPPPVVVLHCRGERSSLICAPWPGTDEIWPDWTGTSVYDVVPLTGTLDGDAVPSMSEDDSQRDAGWLFGTVAEEDGTAGSIADDCDQSGNDWIHLMALRSVGSMQWSDCGILYLIAHRSDLARGDYSSVFSTFGSVG